MKKLFLLLSLILIAFAAAAQDKPIQRPTKKPTQQNVQKPTQQPPKKKPTGNNSPAIQLCPDNDHPHMIDLGLPSGTKWACCNVGSEKPEDFGNYFAWGETETKTTFNWSTYIYCNGTSNTCKSLGSSICGTQYDVAHVKWGGSWQLPSKDQCKELIDNCNYKLTTVNGVKGATFTSKQNGHVIFLPGAKHYWNNNLSTDKSCYGNYWSGTANPQMKDIVYHILLFKDRPSCEQGLVEGGRAGGKTVRAVIQ